MMSKSELRLLSSFVELPEREVSINKLASELDWSLSHTSRIVSDLEKRGVVEIDDTGHRKILTLSDIEPVERLQALMTEYGHVDFPNLVAGAAFRLCYYLDQPRTATELAEASGVSRATVYRRLDDLQAVGIVGKSGSRYEFNDPFSTLSDIARGLIHHQHRREAQRHAHKVNILWETDVEYLFACESDVDADEFHQTGPSQFAEFGIQLLTRSRRHYFRSDRMQGVTPSDLVCHTLLIDDDSRYRTYCLLLIAKRGIEREVLRERAEYYDAEADIDLVSIVDELFEYLETEGGKRTQQLPAWTEFKSTAADYDIMV